MKQTILSLFFTFIFCVSGFSQEARKIDEFGSVSCDEYLNRMDNFQIELSNEPTAKGYILIYEGNLTRYKKGKTYLVLPHFNEAESYKRTIIRRMAFRGFGKEKIVFVKAGFREKLTVEFWLVPLGAEPPKPTPSLKKMKYQKGKPLDFCGDDTV